MRNRVGIWGVFAKIVGHVREKALPMLISLSPPRYQDHIGRLQIVEGSCLWSVFVTTGAIERLSRSEANDESLAAAAEVIEAIARRKLKSGQMMSDRIWIRSLDI